MIRFLQNIFWRLRYPWARTVVEKSVRSLRISLWQEEHFDACVSLHDRNVPHGVPASDRPDYVEGLKSNSVRRFVATEGNRVVGTFAISYFVNGEMPNTIWLSHLMVCPDGHRQGVGTTMFFAALAMLPVEMENGPLMLSALPTALGFYERFGFRWLAEENHSSGQVHRLGVLPVDPVMAAGCRRWLRRAGTTLPEKGVEIPRLPWKVSGQN